MSPHKAQKALDAEVLAAIRKHAKRPGWRVDGEWMASGTSCGSHPSVRCTPGYAMQFIMRRSYESR